MPTSCLRGRFLLRFWPTRCVGFVRRLRGGYAILFGADLFSPTAIALGMPTQSIRGGCLSLGIKRDFPSLLVAATSLIT